MGLRQGIGCISLLFFIFLHIHTGRAALATMSLDLGSQYYKMGLVKQGSSMEIVLNGESRRKTPNLVGIRNGERSFAEPAGQLSMRYPKSVMMHLMDVIGKDVDHPLVQLHTKRFPHTPLEAAENGTLYFVDGDNRYSVESLLAMVLQHAKAETEAFADEAVDEVVIAIPSFLSQRERISIERAAQIAGLKVHELMHCGSAAALSWGAFHRKDIDGKKTTMLVYDMGATHTTATIVQFYPTDKKEMRMKVLGTGYDRTLGGLEITVRLREHLIDRWEKEEKTKSPLRANPRAMAKITAEAERVKQVLSANSEIVSMVESLFEDKNLRLRVTRTELEELLTDLEERMTIPVDDALTMAGLAIDMIDHVVLMGAATRMPLVQKKLSQKVDKELGRFLNTDEATTMGALFQSAHLSKGFKVKPLPLEETVIFPIQAVFTVQDGSGEEKERKSSLFPLSSVYPSPNPRSISFKSFREDFSFVIAYGELSHLKEKQRRELGESELLQVSVSQLKKAVDEMKEGDEWKETKVSFLMDPSGIIRVKSAEAHINRPRGTIEAITDSITGLFGKAEEKEGGDSSEETEGKEKVEEETNKTDDNKNEETAKNVKVDGMEGKNETTKSNSTIIVKDGVARVKLYVKRKRLDGGNSDENERNATKKLLYSFVRAEKLRSERAAAENELEALAFDSSLLLDDEDFVNAATEKEREKISKVVSSIRNWLEDEANSSTETQEFKKRRKDIVKATEGVKIRISEKKEIPAAMQSLKGILSKAKVVVSNVTEGDEELAKDLKKMTEDVTKWIDENDKEVAVNEDYSFSSLEIKMKEQRLRDTAKTLRRMVDKKRKEEEKIRKEEEKKAKEDKKKEEEEKKDNTSQSTEETTKDEHKEL